MAGMFHVKHLLRGVGGAPVAGPYYAELTRKDDPMKMLLATCCLLLATLSGCAVYTPHGAVVVDPHGGHYPPPVDYPDGGGRFCPPGQAKKGNC